MDIGRGRGRARGRSSSRLEQQERAQVSQQGGPPRPGRDDAPSERSASRGDAGPPVLTGAWASRSGAQAMSGAPSGSQAGAPQQRAPAAQGGSGESSHPRGRQTSGGESSHGAGTLEQPVGRGSHRGRRPLPALMVHTRPDSIVSKKGTTGRKIELTANYFKLCSVTDWVLYQHRVDFAPSEDSTSMCRQLVQIHRADLGGYIFDGSNLYSSHRYPKDPMELFSTRPGTEEQIRITVRFIKQVEQGDAQFIQIFNLLIRKGLRGLRLQQVGRNFFDARAKVDIKQHNLELWPGYLTSIRQHESQILMCAEITSKVMRKDTLYNLLLSTQQASRNAIEFQENFKKEALGLVVLTDYNNRTYRVDDVDFETNPRATFTMGDRAISYIDYYKQKYGLTIKYENQPLIVCRSKARELRAGQPEQVYLVPELCRMTGLSDAMRTNFQLMKAVAEFTRIGPAGRVERLLTFSRRLRETPSVVQDFRDWNMEIADRLVQFEGRELGAEMICQGKMGSDRDGNDTFVQYESGAEVDWTGKLRANPMLHIATLDQWAVFAPGQMERDASSFVGMIKRAAQGMGMRIGDPRFVRLPDDRQATYVNRLNEYLGSQRPQLVVCCVSNNNAGRYGAIKKLLCVERPVPSQVITNRAITNRGAMSIATKVAIQMNCKIGGAPWTIQNPISGLMVVGFDVSHDTQNRRRSYGALVASLNKNMSRYFSAVTSHENGQELSDNISLNLMKSLQKFRECNGGKLPQRIIVYRDGVGDGQIEHVYEYEVAKIQDDLAKMYHGQRVFFAFIIVSKRVNTRLFGKGNQNPRPGTVVDDCITLPERYDFFIVSQCVRQGSVSPTSYNVIADTSGLDPDKIQRLTYKMCHLYFNWSGTVKVPAPVQYAHKLAMLVGQNLHAEPHNQLSDLLFFL